MITAVAVHAQMDLRTEPALAAAQGLVRRPHLWGGGLPHASIVCRSREDDLPFCAPAAC